MLFLILMIQCNVNIYGGRRTILSLLYGKFYIRVEFKVVILERKMCIDPDP